MKRKQTDTCNVENTSCITCISFFFLAEDLFLLVLSHFYIFWSVFVIIPSSVWVAFSFIFHQNRVGNVKSSNTEVTHFSIYQDAINFVIFRFWNICAYAWIWKTGSLQHLWLVGQEQGSDQRMRCYLDAGVKGAACFQFLQGTGGRCDFLSQRVLSCSHWRRPREPAPALIWAWTGHGICAKPLSSLEG